MTAFGYTFAGNCRGTTKAGEPCQHRSVYANGLCRQHGGDSSAFMAERIRKIVAKSRARTARRKRRLQRLMQQG
jgi:hypothetical protein